MHKYNTQKEKNPVRNWILLGILFISLLGSLTHFLYDISGKLMLIGMIAPINESIWEHLKLSFLPTILWWILSYIILTRNHKISFYRWFFSAIISLVLCPLFIVSFYYTYTGAFAFHSVILDVSSLFLGIIVAQLMALHIYRYAKLKRWHFYMAIFIFAVLLTAFIVFTFVPPNYPIFRN